MKKLLGFLYFYFRQLLRNHWPRKALDSLENTNLFKMFLREIQKVKFYTTQNPQKFEDLPIVTIMDFRTNFAAFNIHNIGLEDAKNAAEGKSILPNGLSAGFSTGTSGGERGIFLTKELERTEYIATILGKLFSPLELLKLKKIALCLRSGNSLYSSGLSKRIDFKFFPLSPKKSEIAFKLIEYAPDILIAPTQILIEIAKAKPETGTFQHVFYGAEGMNDYEKAYIEKALGLIVRPIYQATEGFLGIGCAKGNLHLNDDIIAFERRHLTHNRFVPIVTDMKRKSQKVVRLELDDILELKACDCGNSGLAVGRNIARKKDLWKLDRIYFPDEIEALIAPLVPAKSDYVIIGSMSKIQIALENYELFDQIANQLSGFGVTIEKIDFSPEINFPKRRHIRWIE